MEAAKDVETARGGGGGGDGGGAEAEKQLSGAASSGNNSANKAKRLLPMELRRRRRAAKLQATIEKQKTPEKEAAKTPEKPAGATPPTRESSAQEQQLRREDSVAPNRPAVSAMARLSSMYSGQALSRKRIKLGHGAHASVPLSFQVDVLPVDLVPKSRVILQTGFPVPFLRPDPRTKKLALERFLSGKRRSRLSRASDDIRPDVRWHQALHYFTHPATPLPASITLNRITAATKSDAVAASAKSELMKEEQAFYLARLHTWQQALRDLYMGFRKRHDRSTFYLRSSEFVVCFYQTCGRPASVNASITDLLHQHANESEADSKDDTDAVASGGDKQASAHTVCAVMSQSNSRIRKALLRLNIEYSLPYSNANNTKREAGEFHLLEEELVALKGGQQSAARTTGMSSAAPAVHGPDSLLLFQGHDAVHGLFEFLINRKPLSSQDVPELFALHPFEHGTIQTLRVTSFGRSGSSASVPSAISEPNEGAGGLIDPAGGMFRLEVKGFCFPESVSEILDALQGEPLRAQERQDRNRVDTTALDAPESNREGAGSGGIALRAYMEPMHGSERLNAAVLASDNLPGGSLALSLLTMADREQRSQMLEFTKRRIDSVVVREARDSRVMVVETTARAAQRGVN